MDPKFVSIGESLDKLVSMDITARGVVDKLYQAARELQDGPLTMAAAAALKARVKPGDRVILITGWPSRSWLIEGLTETDGPVGTALLARVVEEALDCIPIIVTEERLMGYSEACCTAAGLIVTDLDKTLHSKPGPPKAAATAVLPFTTDAARATAAAEEVLAQLQPAAVLAIEMPGRGDDGKYHNVTGREIPDHLVAKTDYLVEAARRQGILTIGIGDGGNEIGMGNIRAAVAQYVPHGAYSGAATGADILVAACISNWGAYGVAAALAALTQKPELLNKVNVERIIEVCVNKGAIDGLSARPDPLVDGTPAAINGYLITMMAMIVTMSLQGWIKG
ncbi:MAG: D-glutamate cyclase [Moorella sp. (in: firmicutes)]|nr:D-glutamate cyclase [Moorella sp. (in: firmicutes)]